MWQRRGRARPAALDRGECHHLQHGCPPRGGRCSGAQSRQAEAARAERPSPDHGRRRARERPRHRRGRGAHRRGRARGQPDRRGPQGRQAGGHRQQGAARQRRWRALRGRSRRGSRPVVRGVRGRCHPADPAYAGIAGRRAHPPGHGDRQRHDQLHPHAHERGRRRLRSCTGGGPESRLRRERSDRRRRGPRRDREGSDPGQHRLRPGRRHR